MGFTKTVLRQGNGVMPQRGQNVTVHCTGYGKNRDLNQKFWSTKDPGQQPFTFAVGMGSVIRVSVLLLLQVQNEAIKFSPPFLSFPKTIKKGWDESVIGMSIGEIAKIHCSPDYAYGSGGFPAWGIMPNSELIFEIEVLSYS